MLNVTMFECKECKLHHMFTFYYRQLVSVCIHWHIFPFFGKILCVITTPITKKSMKSMKRIAPWST